jgi:histidine kinase/DNA gyrase B/HSP90-like ATPase
MRRRALFLLIPLAGLSAGCGGSKHHTAAPASTTTAPAPVQPLQGEAASAATGDIPDNQVFLVFRNAPAGYSIKYPEGWTQQGSGRTVTFRDKNNVVRIVIGRGAAPTEASAKRDLAALHGVTITSPPHAMTISDGPSVKARISLSFGDGAVRLVVEDDGPGVEAGEAELIFDPGSRGTAARGNGAGAGLGLGLALARRLARAAAGDVLAEQATGGRFVVTLPRA